MPDCFLASCRFWLPQLFVKLLLSVCVKRCCQKYWIINTKYLKLFQHSFCTVRWVSSCSALFPTASRHTRKHTHRCSVCTGLPPPTVVTSKFPYMLLFLTHNAKASFYLSFNTNLKFNALIIVSMFACGIEHGVKYWYLSKSEIADNVSEESYLTSFSNCLLIPN